MKTSDENPTVHDQFMMAAITGTLSNDSYMHAASISCNDDRDKISGAVAARARCIADAAMKQRERGASGDARFIMKIVGLAEAWEHTASLLKQRGERGNVTFKMCADELRQLLEREEK